MTPNNRLLAAIVLMLLTLCGRSAMALPDDKNQPIQLRADSAEMNDTKKVSVYVGNVFLKQGSMEIEADKITVYSDDNGVKEVIAEGKPVKFRQQPKVNDPLTKGYSQRLEYFADLDRAILKEQAKLIQGKDTFTGDQIQFDMGKDIVTATSKSKDSQVQMILQPRKQDK